MPTQAQIDAVLKNVTALKTGFVQAIDIGNAGTTPKATLPKGQLLALNDGFGKVGINLQAAGSGIVPSASLNAAILGSDGHPGKIQVTDGKTRNAFGASTESNAKTLEIDGALASIGIRVDGILRGSLQALSLLVDEAGLFFASKTKQIIAMYTETVCFAPIVQSPHALISGGTGGVISVTDAAGKVTIELSGTDGSANFAGDITLANADCAEDFDVEEDANVSPGVVVVLTESGRLRECRQASDTRAIGVISGAGMYKPAMVLDRRPIASGESKVPLLRRAPVALMGKVVCQVDARSNPIRPGDLLTTSTTPGHAAASKQTTPPGAIIGKALGRLDGGLGAIPMLVAPC